MTIKSVLKATGDPGLFFPKAALAAFSCLQWEVDTGENRPRTKKGNGIENLMRLPECSFELVSVHKENKIFTHACSLTRQP
jgi:hypothetical protein